MKKYLWTYQCNRCFIKSGYGFVGTFAEARNNAPCCCGGEPMRPVQGQEMKEQTNEPKD